MSRNDHFQILHIKTCSLKVNIHCDGCKHNVKKIVRKIEACKNQTSMQKSGQLINKLAKAGKYVEIWPTNDQKYPDFSHGGGDDNHIIQQLIRSLNVLKSQPLMHPSQ